MRDPQAATERVGRYQLLEPIGTGPNGVVSRAKVFGVAGFERQFAVKRFSSELTSTPALAQALSAAARQYGSLEHPRIARMAEFGVAQGQTFTAVEYLAGLDAMRLLAEARLAGVSLATGGGLALISQAARAVGYAHGRGLSHLGLAPTNLIVTAEGDVKVTDFGILAAMLPAKPVDVVRYSNRIPYLAPEQLDGEAVSAATDVFVLGVMAYELVTGQRAFRGDTPQEVARSILAGPPPDPPLPRPIVRVLQRCLARSPFERFPDARALADALDAALRVAPVPGTRKDIGAQVKSTLDRIATLNEGQLSGVLALNIGTGPVRAEPQHVATLGRESQELPVPPLPARPNVAPPAVEPPAPPRAAFGRMPGDAAKPDLGKPNLSTMPGLAPPPIPVPPGVTPPSAPPPIPTNTVLGMAAAKKPMVPTSIPPIRPRTQGPPPIPPATPTFTPTDLPDPHEEPTRIGTEIPKLAHSMRKRTDNDVDLIVSIEAEADPQASATIAEPRKPEPDTTLSEPEATLGEHDPSGVERNSAVAERNIERREERPPPWIGTQPGHTPAARPPQRPPTAEPAVQAADVEVPSLADEVSVSLFRSRAGSDIYDAPAGPDESHVEAADEAPVPPMFDAPPPAPAPASPPPPAAPPAVPRAATPPPIPASIPQPDVPPAGAKRRAKWPLIVVPFVVLAAAAGGAWQIWGNTSEGEKSVAVGSGSAGSNVIAHASTPDAATKPIPVTATPDATVAATAPVDASVQVAVVVDAEAHAVAAPDAAVVAQAVDAGAVQPAPSDALQIASTPAGARVFIDGADQGTTPVKLPGSADRHTVALLLAGHELYVAEVDGHGAFNIALKPVTPEAGPAGIKVIKCKDKDRYYVTIDGKPTGMTCPTERIECTVGPHTVEVYDIVTESRKKFDINVTDTRLSYRVRVE